MLPSKANPKTKRCPQFLSPKGAGVSSFRSSPPARWRIFGVDRLDGIINSLSSSTRPRGHPPQIHWIWGHRTRKERAAGLG